LDSIRLVLLFVWHVLAACALFIVLCFGAIGLNLFTRWMVHLGMPVYITSVGSLLECLIFTTDVLCFVVYVIKEAALLIHQIMRQ
jgi:hypothetical protein